MRRQYFRLSALLVAFFVVSLGVTPLLASENVQSVDIQYQGTKVNHRATFEISFSSFSRFFRTAYHRVNEVLPFTPPTPPDFDPIDNDPNAPIFWLGKPGQKDDPNEVPSGPGINDGADPIL